jgi:phosphotransferase system enzyme I (PtsP)
MATNRDRFALIESISTIGSESTENLRDTLDRVVGAIARSMEVEVCSLYLFDPQHERLVLRATIGLDRDSVGRVSMRVSEGLVGLAIESQSPVVVEDSMSHPRYKYFPETGEERYHTFLGVPVQEGAPEADRRAGGPDAAPAQGQQGGDPPAAHGRQPGRADPYPFSIARDPRHQGKGTRRVSPPDDRGESPAQGLRKGRRQATRLAAPVKVRRPRLVGLAAPPRIRHGVAHVVGTFLSSIDRNLRARDPKIEIKRLEEAVVRSRGELAALKVRMEPLMPEAELKIFDGHRLILEDEEFVGRVREAIDAGFAAESALFRVIDDLSAQMLAVADGYLRERATDFRDVGHRVLRHLAPGRQEKCLCEGHHPDGRRADAFADDAGFARKSRRYRTAIGRGYLARRDSGARL